MILKIVIFLLPQFQHQLIQKEKPDFTALLNVCKIIGPLLKKKDIVVFLKVQYFLVQQRKYGPELKSTQKN